MADKAVVSFESLANFPGWDASLPKRLIEEYGCKTILEIGSGANPTIEPEFVRERRLRYVTSDVDPEEMDKADPVYERSVLNISTESINRELVGQFDMVFSRMVGEHVSNGQKFHQNIHALLSPGGISAHCFSTLWALPFTANRFLPEFLAHSLLTAFAPRDTHRHGKYPAHYSWSRGPSRTMIRRLEGLGFELLKYTGYFGHRYYARLTPVLHRFEMIKTDFLLHHPVPALCSYATLILRKR
jgi:2-polyprenyl-3-methyl-5-hydroxy-6-metoxy-1,4-benzoquinol methylase